MHFSSSLKASGRTVSYLCFRLAGPSYKFKVSSSATSFSKQVCHPTFHAVFLCFKYEGLEVLRILLLQTLCVVIWTTLVQLRRMKTSPAAATISVEKTPFFITSKPAATISVEKKHFWSLPNLPSSCTQLSHWHCDMNWYKSLLATLTELQKCHKFE